MRLESSQVPLAFDRDAESLAVAFHTRLSPLNNLDTAGVQHAVDLCAAPGSWSQVRGAYVALTTAFELQHSVCSCACLQVLSRRLYLPAVQAGR